HIGLLVARSAQPRRMDTQRPRQRLPLAIPGPGAASRPVPDLVGVVALKLALTPTVMSTRSTPWAVGGAAILPRAVLLLVLLALAEHLTSPDRPESHDAPESGPL
ncbi:hypothetical protein, partial [Streptomyces alfalfae]